MATNNLFKKNAKMNDYVLRSIIAGLTKTGNMIPENCFDQYKLFKTEINTVYNILSTIKTNHSGCSFTSKICDDLSTKLFDKRLFKLIKIIDNIFGV